MKYKTLRHITNKKSLGSIIKEGELSSEYLLRTQDRSYISFEANPNNDTLFQVFHLLKENLNWKENEKLELLFDAQRLINGGYIICKDMDGVNFPKEEIDFPRSRRLCIY